MYEWGPVRVCSAFICFSDLFEHVVMDALNQSEPSVADADGLFVYVIAAMVTYVLVATVLTFYVLYQRRSTRIDRRRLKEFRDLVARLKNELRSVHEASTSTSLRSIQLATEMESLRRDLTQLSKRFAGNGLTTLTSDPTSSSPAETLAKTQLQIFRGEAVVFTTSTNFVPVDDEPDDLTSIWGVGPNSQQKLQEHGVLYFEQIAAWNKAQIEYFNSILGFKGRIERERWVEQAQAKLIEQGRSGAA